LRATVVVVESRIVIVTGAASGIGRATAARFAADGATVIATDVTDEAGAEAAAAMGARYEHLDVADPDAWTDLIARVDRDHGRIDVLHLNAGIRLGASDPATLDLDAYRRLIDINQHGVLYGLVAALGPLTVAGGDIVVTASRAAVEPLPNDLPYVMAKHAVAGLVRSVAPTLTERNIRINAICPAIVDTGFLGGARQRLEATGLVVMDAEEVADGVMAILASGSTGECFVQQLGEPPVPFEFARPPR